MRQEKKDNIINLYFDSMAEYAEWANTVPSDNYSKTFSHSSFCKFSFDKAMKMALNGNPEYTEQIIDGLEAIKGNGELDKGLELMRDVEGDFFDVGEFVSGEPECFRKMEVRDVKPCIDVYVVSDYMCNIHQNEIINRGSAVVALVDELSRQGYCVNLNVTGTFHYSGKNILIHVDVCNNPIDIDQVAFMLANPCFVRRIGFAALEKITGKSYCDSYGSSVYENLIDKGNGFFFGLLRSGYWNTVEKSRENILDMVKEYNETGKLVKI